MGSDLYGKIAVNTEDKIFNYLIINLSRVVEKVISGGIVKSKSLYALVKNKKKFIIIPNGVDTGIFNVNK